MYLQIIVQIMIRQVIVAATPSISLETIQYASTVLSLLFNPIKGGLKDWTTARKITQRLKRLLLPKISLQRALPPSVHDRS